ncbi:hypothetical protein NBO_74g0001 [Nosema bombycis CQ1]|uniref:Uncharacterized protein n=1 Tax=Nosema bombycis (strain CQ1 / CVCC 102059) TaxID=578461 RepID=R0KRP5_NOSB1|nr:hypothetical protein NBO_74g0001 [Nosema bombycis CQ1]|eukprot:EOB13426.1 hypothetical protein NBO_74g0001 [Nosema bombycis CQ1]
MHKSYAVFHIRVFQVPLIFLRLPPPLPFPTIPFPLFLHFMKSFCIQYTKIHYFLHFFLISICPYKQFI